MFTVGSNRSIIYSKSNNAECEKQLDFSNKKNRDDYEYFIEFDEKGKVVQYYITNGLYQYGSNKEDLKATDIDEVQLLSKISEDEKYIIGCDYVVNHKERCTDKLLTDKGSFSTEKEEKEICVELTEDQYSYSFVEYEKSSKEITDEFKTLVAKVKLGENKTNKFEINNDGENIIEIDYDSYPQTRYSIKNGLLEPTDTISVVVGEYDINNLVITASEGVEYELLYVSDYKLNTYTGPWIRNQRTIDKISNLFKYNLLGFTNCDSNNKCEGHKYKAVFKSDLSNEQTVKSVKVDAN